MDESRKKFEEWWENRFGEEPLMGWVSQRTKDGGYKARGINDMWESWKASKELFLR